MGTLVADASGLVSLGIVAHSDPDPFSIYLDHYQAVVPDTVVEELREIAEHDDVHGRAARTVLDRADAFRTEAVDLDTEFPLDDRRHVGAQTKYLGKGAGRDEYKFRGIETRQRSTSRDVHADRSE